MPDASSLKAQLVAAGYTLVEYPAPSGHLACRIRGGNLGVLEPFLRADSEMCSTVIGLGSLGAVPPQHRFDVAVDLLALNFDHPLAKVELFRVPPEVDKEKNIAILVGTTAFYWTEFTAAKFTGRMAALGKVSFAASQLLNAREALLPTNPYFKQLNGHA